MGKKTVMSREPAANCGAMDRLPFPVVVAANAIALYIKQYDKGECTPSELARSILDAASVLTAYEQIRLREYFKSCNNP